MRQRKLLRWAAIFLVSYTLIGFLVAPWLIKTIVLWQMPKKIGRPVALQKFRLNPFTFSVTIGGFAIQERDGTPFVRWDEVYVNFDPTGLLSRQLVFSEVSVSNAFGHVQINHDGTFNFTDILQRFPSEPSPARKSAGKPLVVRVGRLQVTGSRLVYNDLTRATPFATTVGPISVTMHNFSTDPNNDNPYGFTAITESGEKFSWRGDFFLSPIRSSGEFAIEGIAFKKYAPYYNDFVNLAIRGGTFDVSAHYRAELTDRLTVAQVSNLTVAVHALKISARDSETALIEVPELKLTGTQGDLIGQHVEVGRFECDGARFDIERFADGTLNLLKLLAPPSTKPATVASSQPSTNAPAMAWVATVGEVNLNDWGFKVRGFVGEQQAQWHALRVTGIEAHAQPVSLRVGEVALVEPQINALIPAAMTNAFTSLRTGKTNAPPSKPAGPPAALPPIQVGSIIVTNGALSYADKSVSPEAGIGVSKLNVAIHGLSSASNSVADIAVTGRVDDVAPIEITGRINPLSIDAATAMQVAFKGINLVPVGPYSGKYAGYLIRKGKLTLELKYDIQQRALKASNNILVDQFTFGEKTDSPDAVKLPVKLAVAILKDVNGQIKLDVPVEGRIDDPKFRYWGAVWHVVGSLFTKIFTAPFSLLGSMFGGGGEELSYQEFAPGSATLTTDQTKKLDVLIKAMTERPGLNLEITGSIDPVKEVEPLKRQKLASKIAGIRAQREPGNTNAVSAVEYAALLRELYAAALPEIQPKQTPPPEPPRPRFYTNIEGFRPPGQPEPAPEIKTSSQAKKAAAELTVEAMEQGYLPLIELTDADYRQLANDRVASVVRYLKEKGHIADDRLLVSKNPNLPLLHEGARTVFGLQ